MGIVSWIVVGAIAGWVAGTLIKSDKSLGVVGHVVMGIVGALIGGFVAGMLLRVDYINHVDITTIVVATIGAVLVVLAMDAAGDRRPGGRVV